MAEITKEQYKLAYEYGKKVSSGTMTANQAIVEVKAQSGMSDWSANKYVTKARHMLKGTLFRSPSTINNAAAEYYLKRIREDFGDEGVEKAIKSLEQFVEYSNHLRIPRLGMKKLIAKYKG